MERIRPADWRLTMHDVIAYRDRLETLFTSIEADSQTDRTIAKHSTSVLRFVAERFAEGGLRRGHRSIGRGRTCRRTVPGGLWQRICQPPRRQPLPRQWRATGRSGRPGRRQACESCSSI